MSLKIKQGIQKDNVKQVQQQISQARKLIADYQNKKMPDWVRSKIVGICDDATALMKTQPIFPTELAILNGKSAYYNDAERRKLEIFADTASGMSATSQEGAYSYTLNLLQKEANVSLLAEIVSEIIKQNPNLVDLRSLSEVQGQYFVERNAQRQQLYSASITADWAKINDNFNKTGQLYIDLGEYRVTPCILNTDGSIHDGFATKPTDQVGICYSYDTIYEKNNADWCAELMEHQKHMQNISFTNIKSLRWNCAAYSQRVENIYASFKGMIDAKLEEFKARHGGDVTRILILKASDIQYKCLSETLMLGYKIEFTSCPATESQPKQSKKSIWRR